MKIWKYPGSSIGICEIHLPWIAKLINSFFTKKMLDVTIGLAATNFHTFNFSYSFIFIKKLRSWKNYLSYPYVYFSTLSLFRRKTALRLYTSGFPPFRNSQYLKRPTALHLQEMIWKSTSRLFLWFSALIASIASMKLKNYWPISINLRIRKL